MNLIALLIGLAIERLATQIFHWRRMRWMDRLIDAGFARAASYPNLPPLVAIALLSVLLALPVLIVIVVLGDSLLGFPYLFLAIVVLFFSLGPNDIGEDISRYCAALEADDEERLGQTVRTLVEIEPPESPIERIQCVEEAVFIQANNRMFAIIFWFVALGPFGPLGAWLYRVTDLVRRRAVFSAGRLIEQNSDIVALKDAAVLLHGWLAWIPARLTAIGYGIAGHLDAALAAWRAPADAEDRSGSEASEDLLARVGVASLALPELEGESVTARGVRGATAANHLVFRLLMIWAVIISAMTLYGWSM
jgi:AmpE protein